jgi:hypothetical protein
VGVHGCRAAQVALHIFSFSFSFSFSSEIRTREGEGEGEGKKRLLRIAGSLFTGAAPENA